LGESLAHELTHLFSERWNRWAPPLVNEGLSTWLQGTMNGRPIHEAAVVQCGSQYSLRQLLDTSFFFQPTNCHACYVLSGSFIGFLISRFGWGAWRKFYCVLRGAEGFDVTFFQHFGMSLDDADRLWRTSLRCPRS
jgi:hypothetical protein